MPFELLKLAYREGITVDYWDFAPPIRGVYLRMGGVPPNIGLSKALFSSRRDFRCVLAEEIGHHYTTAGYCITCVHYNYANRLNITRAEYRALKWAATYLIPEDKLLCAVRRGIVEIWSLIEYFDVTEQMMWFRLGLMSETQHAYLQKDKEAVVYGVY